MQDSHIIIAAAVDSEVSGLMDRLERPVFSHVGGRKIIAGSLEGRPVKILVTGPGVVNTVQALSAAIENSRPSLIIQTGCAGAFREAGLNIGDIGIATQEIDIHLGIEPEKGDQPLNELPFPVITKNDLEIKNRYPLNQQLVTSAFHAVKEAFEPGNIRTVKGPFVTVSTITATDNSAKNLHKRFSACMENMEGSGAAHLSIHYDIPFLEIRSASNFAGKRDRASWDLPLAFERGARAVLAFIRDVPLIE
jgi:futalosine hydrolase